MPDTPQNGDDLTFEQALERLETIIDQLEEGDFTLDESIDSYEEGLGLAQMCLDQLQNAELRMQELTLDESE